MKNPGGKVPAGPPAAVIGRANAEGGAMRATMLVPIPGPAVAPGGSRDIRPLQREMSALPAISAELTPRYSR